MYPSACCQDASSQPQACLPPSMLPAMMGTDKPSETLYNGDHTEARGMNNSAFTSHNTELGKGVLTRVSECR